MKRGMNFQISRAGVIPAASLILVLILAMAPPAPAATTSVVKVLAASNPVVLGQNDSIAASVNLTAAAVPSGTITLLDTVQCPGASAAAVTVLGTITLGSASSGMPGAGTLAAAFPCIGDNSVVASYGGDSNYTAGTSQPLLVTVLAQFTPTSTTLVSSLNPSASGQSVTFTARVGYTLTANTFPTGTVTFTDTNTRNILGTAKVQTSGSGLLKVTAASITTSSLGGGYYAVQAAYSGDNIYSSSASQVVSQAVSGPANSSLPAITAGGVASASQFGDFTSIAPGTWIEIYGSNLAADTRSWTNADFQGANAPTSLDQTSVTIGGKAAFVGFISPGQLNVQVPSNVPAGLQLLSVTTPSGSSAPYIVNVNATQPGLLAPSSFAIGGKQYVVALFPDGATFALPSGAVSGLASRPARPGETITLWGIGFGPVIPDIPAGQIVLQTNTLAAPLQIFIGGVPAQVTYSGLAPELVGLYQFNVVVPNVTGSDTVPLTFTLGGLSGTQTLYVAVQN
jgi:uncharacterized protein (TIGR03437 family)